MNIKLKRIDDAYNFEALGESPVNVTIDGSEAIGGHNAGARPMELVLMGLGGCIAIDVISILKKQRQQITDYEISVDAERKKDETPSTFEWIKVTHKMSGEIDEVKLSRAIELSVKKYCSVSAILKPTAKLEYFYQLNGSQIKKLEK